MTDPHVTGGGGRRQTQLTRARILAAARQQLGRDPDSSLSDIAEAADVVRRTVYDHFAGRSVLVEGLVADAGEALRRALAAVAIPDADTDTDADTDADTATDTDAISALARFVLALWPVGDRCRTLLRLSPQDLGAERAHDILGPARDMAAAIIERGQRQGVFHTSVPPEPLSRSLERLLLALLECVNAGTWSDDGTRAATAALIAVGVDGDRAAAQVHGLGRPSLVDAR
ncbi:TetR/AcrR family transcriptional regulator [Streptomyces sp. ISL-22]|uniref:TetR/AcrR family transcriptional regulator n=1 Tax=unclassified Streptomyces TaxID=2593676 RepID=UPI001BE7ABFD|nr:MULTISPECIES: TetR/AcrR family transcriptional regulator [unclassified Streptomyces]MBT2422799.1 TetR/AcrR family transcriptional regulator [Streptomyces sp. ISL-24]MBT2431120.1 TetR/AcrR family transcriptional regulator [Streptomyces sp. ISL-22]